MDGHREIVFDTETTGFDAKGADRITEIGCIEIIDLLPTGRQFQSRGWQRISYAGNLCSPTKQMSSWPLLGIPLWLPIMRNSIWALSTQNSSVLDVSLCRRAVSKIHWRWRMPSSQARPPPLMLCVNASAFHCLRVINMAPSLTRNSSQLFISSLDAKPAATQNESGFPTAKSRPTPLRVDPTEAELEAHREFVGSFKTDAVWEKLWKRRERGRGWTW